MLRWLDTIAGSIEPNTYESYRAIIKRYIEPYFSAKKLKLQALEPQHIQEFYNKQLLGSGYMDNDYVCKRDNGEPFMPDYLTNRFLQVLRKKKLPHIRFHDLRHSAASML